MSTILSAWGRGGDWGHPQQYKNLCIGERDGLVSGDLLTSPLLKKSEHGWRPMPSRSRHSQGLGKDPSQPLNEVLPVGIVPKDLPPLDASDQHMVQRP